MPRIGDRVVFVVGKDIEGIITGVQQTPASNLFRVGWLHNGEYKEAWVYGIEILPVPDAAAVQRVKEG
jgi:hypothetical protein